MDEVIPHLWLGDLACALAPDYLELAGVTHILTAMKQRLPPPPVLPGGRSISQDKLHHVKVDDLEDAPILVHLPAAVEWLKEVLDERWVEPSEEDGQEGWWEPGANVVYVHCQAGVSRSATIVLAYLMHTRSLSLHEALELVRSRRPHIEPNAGFMTQLELYEAGGCSVDVRHQPIRRFLMSQTSILNGDSIDDVLLAYYPSPPASESRRRSSSAASSGSSRPKMSPTTMSRVGSRTGKNETVDLSKSPPLPAGAELLDSDPEGQDSALSSTAAQPGSSANTGLSSTSARATNLQSSVSGPADIEFKITSNNGRLPGGVASVRGNEGVRNRGKLQRPTFQGAKLSCKMCRRELAASDHVVDHTPGAMLGRGSFASRRRKKDWDKLSREEKFGASTASGSKLRSHTAGTESAEEGESRTAHSAASATAPSGSTQDASREGASTSQHSSSSSSASSSSTATAAPTPTSRPMQSAASLTASLPPALAALRLGRSSAASIDSSGSFTPGNLSGSSPSNPSATTSSASHMPSTRAKLIHSTNCSAYFVEPLQWMAALREGEIAGKLDCPNKKCRAKLGNWDWAGMQCGW